MKLRDINNMTDIKNFLPGYHVEKWLFRGALIIVALILLFVGYTYGFDFKQHFYYGCPAGGATCDNDYYLQFYREECKTYPSLCLNRYLVPGEFYGEKAPEGFSDTLRAATWLMVLVVAGAVFANHFGFNRNYGLWKKVKEAGKDANLDNGDD